jgi:uncharacterized protein
MTGETDLSILLKNIRPFRNEGEYVFCTVDDLTQIDTDDVIGTFKEKECVTLILPRVKADKMNLAYSVVFAWITLTVHSSLEAVGLTAAFSKALSAEGISCNVVAAFYHDHIFVNINDAEMAIKVLSALTH